MFQQPSSDYYQVQWLQRLERIIAAVIVRQDDLITIFNIVTKLVLLIIL